MSSFRVIPYKKGSKSARELANSLGGKRLRREGSGYKQNSNHVVINWGCSNNTIPEQFRGFPMLNRPDVVGRATNKLHFFEMLQGQDINIPEFTTDREVALDWIDDGKDIVCRATLTGHSGEGITIIDTESEDQVPEVPLYTRYVKKAEEYRIHVMGTTIISKQRKARRRDVPDDQVNWKVRNVAGGFVFARNEDHTYPKCVLDAALKAIEISQLDFGAVDIIYNASQEKAYVLEINTACGLEGTTLEDYKNGFSQRLCS